MSGNVYRPPMLPTLTMRPFLHGSRLAVAGVVHEDVEATRS